LHVTQFLSTELSRHNFNRIESIHYNTLRIAIKDRRKRVCGEVINKITSRMPPRTWMKYISSSTAIKIIRDAAPTSLYQKLMKNSYQERRKQSSMYTFDASHNKHGKKGYHNWINLMLKLIKFPWYNLTTPLTNDRLRILLKKNFYYY